MKKSTSYAVFTVVVFVVLTLGTCAFQYNKLVRSSESVEGAWAQVDNVLQRRADLVPNLVETVKGYAAQEKEIFTEVARARSRLLAARGPEETEAATGAFDSALGRLLAIAENYPQLKSNENFIRLQDELAGTENRIAVERMRYNNVVREHNVRIRRFPTNLVASVAGFEQQQYFEAEQGAREVPQVKFTR